MPIRLFNRDGIQFKLPIEKGAVYDLDRLEKIIVRAKSDLRNLKARSEGLDQMRYELPGEYVIRSMFGYDEITITPPKIKGGEVERKREETTYGERYVLLVEMGSGLAPEGFAIFAPTGAGEGEGGDGNVNLGLIGWTKKVGRNIDPPGLIDQSTFRVGWCLDTIFPGYPFPVDGVLGELDCFVKQVYVEEIKRVDQGWTAYDGSAREEEITALGFENNIWTYYDYPRTITWKEVNPGAPPEELCGYTWAPHPEYGGSEADFHDVEHLFYTVLTGGMFSVDAQVVSWWPPEFNQLITIENKYDVEGGLFQYKAYNDEGIWYFDSEGPPMDAAFGDYFIPGTHNKMPTVLDDTFRAWGNIWGSSMFYLEDRGNPDFPYTSYEPYRYKWATTSSDANRTWLNNGGVYVYSQHKEMHISGFRWRPASCDTGTIWYYRGDKRTAESEDDRFVNIEHPRRELTAREKELLQGNEDSLPWIYDPFRSYIDPNGENTIEFWWYEHSERTRDIGEIRIWCARKEFKIFNEEALGSNGFQCKTGYFPDYGIFTKVGKGIDKNNNVVHGEVDPIYVYSVAKRDEDLSDGTHEDPESIIYGMVVDDKHFRTEEFTWAGGIEFNVPGTEKSGLKCNYRVRAGIMKFKIPTYSLTETEVE